MNSESAVNAESDLQPSSKSAIHHVANPASVDQVQINSERYCLQSQNVQLTLLSYQVCVRMAATPGQPDLPTNRKTFIPLGSSTSNPAFKFRCLNYNSL